MIKLLKSDFYRLFRSKFFYIMLGISFLMTFFVFLIYSDMSDITKEGSAYAFSALDFQRLTMDEVIGVFMAIAAGIFIGSDYACGGIRNKVMTGCGRTKIFLSKFICLLVVAFCFYLSSQLIVYIFGSFKFGWKGVTAYHACSLFIAGLIRAFAYAAIFTAISFAVRNVSTSIIIGVVAVMVISLLLPILYMVGEAYNSSMAKNIYNLLVKILPSGQGSGLSSGSKDYWLYISISAVWVAVSGVVGWLRFRSIELK